MTTAEKTLAWLLCAELLLLIKIVTPNACNDSLDAHGKWSEPIAVSSITGREVILRAENMTAFHAVVKAENHKHSLLGCDQLP